MLFILASLLRYTAREGKTIVIKTEHMTKYTSSYKDLARFTHINVHFVHICPLTLKGPEGGTWCPPHVIQSNYSIEMMIRSIETLCKFIFACLRPIEKKTERSICNGLILAAFSSLKPQFSK